MRRTTTNQPCPRCGGADRFFLVAAPRNGGSPFWMCRQCRHTESSGDSDVPAVQLRILSPDEQEQVRIAYGAIADWSADYLWSNQPDAREALAYLHARGFRDEALRSAKIGYHPAEQARGAGTALYRRDPEVWAAAQLGGLLGPQGKLKSVLRGTLTMPYWRDGVCTLIRGRAMAPEAKNRYLSPGGVPIYAGGVPTLYLADMLPSADTVLLCEGELKALAAAQAGIPAVGQPGIGYMPESFVQALANKIVVVAYDVEQRTDPFTPSPGELYTLALVARLCGISQQQHIEKLYAVLEKMEKARKSDDIREQSLLIAQQEAAKQQISQLKRELAAINKLGIRVKVLRLPRRADETKVDLDGWLLKNSPDLLRQMIQHAPAGEDWHAAHSGGEFRYTRNGMSNGEQIANYKAKITETLYIHDGQSTTTMQRLALATPSGRRVSVDIADEDWADDRRALKAIRVGLREGTFDDNPTHALRAIRLLSNHGDPPVDRRIYTCTGWEQIDGNWYYLAPDGAIGATGINPEMRAEIDPEAAGNHYQMCGPGDAQTGAAAWLSFLRGQVCPQPLALLLAGQAMLSIVHRFSGNAARSMVWLHHETGSFKTALVRAGIMALWGPRFTAERADGAPVPKWDSTSVGLNLVAFYYRDAALLLDDYKSGMITPEAFRRFLHAYSESTSRTRATQKVTIDKQRPARTTIFSTAEDVPQGDPGMQARLLSLVLKPETINQDALASLQRAGADGHLAAFWRSLIQRIAGELNTYGPSKIQEGMQALIRADEAPMSNHRRTAGALRQNRAAWLMLCSVLRQAGYISQDEAITLNHAHLNARSLLTADMNERQKESRPSQIFLSVLSELLSSGELVVEHEGMTCSRCDEPLRRSHDGWFCTGTGCTYHLPAAKIVGFALGEGIGIFAQKAFREVSRVRNDQRQPFAYSATAIWQQLDADGVLVQRDQSSGRPYVTRRNPANRGADGKGKPETVLLIKRECVITPDSELDHENTDFSFRSFRSRRSQPALAHQDAENEAPENSIPRRSRSIPFDPNGSGIERDRTGSNRFDPTFEAVESHETGWDRKDRKIPEESQFQTIPARVSVGELKVWRSHVLALLREYGTPREMSLNVMSMPFEQLRTLHDTLLSRKKDQA